MDTDTALTTAATILVEHYPHLTPEGLRTALETSQTSQATDSRLLTIPQVADRLGVCERTVASMVAEGQLPSVKIRRARRVPLSSLTSLGVS